MTVNVGDKFTIPSKHSTECGGYDFYKSADMVTVTVVDIDKYFTDVFTSDIEGHIWHNEHHGDLVQVKDEYGDKQIVSIEFLKSWKGN